MKQDYSKGDVFVPSGGAFPATSDPGLGPKMPSNSDLGPIAVIVQHGAAFGAVRDSDGARIMGDKKPNFPSKLKTGHLPENA